MKTKNLALILLIAAVFAVVAVLSFDAFAPDFSLNMKKYHSETLENMQVSFHGSFGKINMVKIKPDGEKSSKVKLEGDAAALEKNGVAAVEVCDLNGDGVRDLLLLTRIDNDGDVHRALSLSTGDGYVLAEGVDAVNARIENGILIAEEKNKLFITEEDDAAPYEQSSVKYEYQYVDGSVILTRKTVITYYSDSDIYCLGIWEHDQKYDELTVKSEDWLSVAEYTRDKQAIADMFFVDIPE